MYGAEPLFAPPPQPLPDSEPILETGSNINEQTRRRLYLHQEYHPTPHLVSQIRLAR